MTTPPKIIVSFLLSASLFAGIAFLAYTGFFDVIECRFYNSAVTEGLIREAARDAQVLNEHLTGLQDRSAVSARSLAESLVAAGRIGAAENLVLCAASAGGADLAGIVSGVPGTSGGEIIAKVSEIWSDGYRSIVPFFSAGETLVLVSVPMEQGFYYGRIINEAVLVFPPPVQILALAAIFLTMFLIIFFLLSLKQKSPVKMVPSKATAADQQGFLVVREEEVGGKGLLAAATDVAKAASSTDVIYEQNGIPYISSNAFNSDNNAEEKLDSNFANLIESVVNRKLSPPAPRN